MSDNDHQAEEMQEYFARAPKYWSEGKIYLSGKHELIAGKTYVKHIQ
jgi:hypothetical protein